jgi:hypothetical protein
MPSWLARNRRAAPAAAAIALAVIVMVAAHLPMLGNGEFDWDEGVYWISMQTMRSGHALFSSVYSSQPPAFLLLTEPPWALLGGGIAAARAVMLLWGAVAVVAGGVIGWRLGGRVAAVARQALVLQADGPATSLGLVAVALAAVAVTTSRRRWGTVAAALGGAALVIGLLTKLLDLAVVPPMVVVLAGRGLRHRLWAAAAGGALIAACAVLLPMRDAWAAMWSDAIGLHLSSQSLTSGITLSGALHERWQLGALAVAGAVAGWRRHRRLVVAGAAWVAGALLAMDVTHPLWPHHTVSASPGYALLVGAGVSSVSAWVVARPWRRSTEVATGLSIALAAFAVLYMLSGLRHLGSLGFDGLASQIAHDTPATAQVLGDEQFAQALAQRAAPPAFVDTSNTRLYTVSGDLQRLKDTAAGRAPVCAVLFSSGRFASLPGFEALVARRYPVRLSLGTAHYLYLVPGCH